MSFSAEALSAALSPLAGGAAAARYCLAFSGGLDSTALLHAAVQLRLPLRAIHINHHLQPASGDWAAHCRQVAAKLSVPLTVHDVQVATGPGISTEAAARDARYAVFREELQEGEGLLTAHHQDDQLETVFLQLLRGAGVPGLAAMPAATPFGQGRHLRPLLGFARSDLETFLRAFPDAAWIEDPSNANVQFDRNYLRNRLLPLLLERWPTAAANVSRSASHLAEAQSLLEDLARHDLESAGQGEALSVETLRKLSPPRARNLLRYWIRQSGARPPSTVKLQEILRQMLESRIDSHPRVDWEGAEIRRRQGLIYLHRQ